MVPVIWVMVHKLLKWVIPLIFIPEASEVDGFLDGSFDMGIVSKATEMDVSVDLWTGS